MTYRKGTPVLFHVGERVVQGVVVSARRSSAYLVQATEGATYWRTHRQLLPTGKAK